MNASPTIPSASSAQATQAEDRSQQGFFMVRGLILPLPRNRPIFIGRDKTTCDITLPDQRVSKQHVAITHENAKYFITDLGSLNRTFLNNEELTTKMALMPGDEVRITPFSLMFIGPDSLDNSALAPGLDKADESHFSGQLHTLRITDLVQLINSTFQSGLLTISDKRNQRAEVIFVNGEIVAAHYGKFKDEDAVHALMALQQGEFDFYRGEQTVPTNPIKKRTQTMLFEACQMMDERAGASSSAASPDTIRITHPLFVPDPK